MRLEQACQRILFASNCDSTFMLNASPLSLSSPTSGSLRFRDVWEVVVVIAFDVGDGDMLRACARFEHDSYDS